MTYFRMTWLLDARADCWRHCRSDWNYSSQLIHLAIEQQKQQHCMHYWVMGIGYSNYHYPVPMVYTRRTLYHWDLATFLIWNAGIAVISSIAIPTAELVSSFQFQVSHNTIANICTEANIYSKHLATSTGRSWCRYTGQSWWQRQLGQDSQSLSESAGRCHTHCWSGKDIEPVSQCKRDAKEEQCADVPLRTYTLTHTTCDVIRVS